MDVQCEITSINDRLISFQEAKGSILERAAELEALARKLEKEEMARSVSAVVRKLDEERFYLAVLGNFKRGKSTFINALLGSPILPTGVVPLTSVVTKLSYDVDDRAVVTYEDGGKRTIELDALEDYITERGNPGNKKSIAEVDVLVNSPLLQRGVILVDTPGIGSTYISNTRATYDFLSKLDAAIIVIGSDPPISEVELDFVREVKPNVEGLFFVQNKMDRANAKDWNEALLFSKTVLEKDLKMDIKLYPLSSLNALEAKSRNDREKLLESGLPVLEADLEHFIMVEKGQLLLRSASRKLQRIVSDLRTSVDMEQRVMCEMSQTLDDKISWLEKEIGSVKRRMDEIEYLIDGGVDRVTKTFDEELDAFKRTNRPLLMSRLDEFFDELGPDHSAKTFAERTEQFLTTCITDTYKPFIEMQGEKFTASFGNIVARFEREADALDESFKQEVSAMFNIEIIRSVPSALDLGKSRFYFDRAAVLNYNSVIPAEMPFLLPKPLYQRTMRKRAMNAMVDDLDKYGGRIRYDLVYRLSESARRVKSEQRTRLMATVDTMNEAVQAGLKIRCQAQEIKERRTEQINGIKSELDRIKMYLFAISEN